MKKKQLKKLKRLMWSVPFPSIFMDIGIFIMAIILAFIFSQLNNRLTSDLQEALSLHEKYVAEQGYLFSEGLSVLEEGESYGYIDKQKHVFRFKYTPAENFSEGAAVVTDQNNTYWLLSHEGNEISLDKYDVVGNFKEGLACVRNSINGNYGFIDQSGTEIIECQFYDASNFSEGLARVRNSINGNYGFIDKHGREIIPCKYYEASNFSDGVAIVSRDYAYYLIDKTGKEFPLDKYYLYIGNFKEGCAVVCDSEYNYGFINKNGTEIVPTKYKYASDFHDGLAVVLGYNNRYGYIDKTGQLVIPLIYQDACEFHEGCAFVKTRKKGGWEVIRKPKQ